MGAKHAPLTSTSPDDAVAGAGGAAGPRPASGRPGDVPPEALAERGVRSAAPGPGRDLLLGRALASMAASNRHLDAGCPRPFPWPVRRAIRSPPRYASAREEPAFHRHRGVRTGALVQSRIPCRVLATAPARDVRLQLVEHWHGLSARVSHSRVAGVLGHLLLLEGRRRAAPRRLLQLTGASARRRREPSAAACRATARSPSADPSTAGATVDAWAGQHEPKRLQVEGPVRARAPDRSAPLLLRCRRTSSRRANSHSSGCKQSIRHATTRDSSTNWQER
jgi:hypothetical protein